LLECFSEIEATYDLSYVIEFSRMELWSLIMLGRYKEAIQLSQQVTRNIEEYEISLGSIPINSKVDFLSCKVFLCYYFKQHSEYNSTILEISRLLQCTKVEKSITARIQFCFWMRCVSLLGGTRDFVEAVHLWFNEELLKTYSCTPEERKSATCLMKLANSDSISERQLGKLWKEVISDNSCLILNHPRVAKDA
jgi:hypothetical protein